MPANPNRITNGIGPYLGPPPGQPEGVHSAWSSDTTSDEEVEEEEDGSQYVDSNIENSPPGMPVREPSVQDPPAQEQRIQEVPAQEEPIQEQLASEPAVAHEYSVPEQLFPELPSTPSQMPIANMLPVRVPPSPITLRPTPMEFQTAPAEFQFQERVLDSIDHNSLLGPNPVMRLLFEAVYEVGAVCTSEPYASFLKVAARRVGSLSGRAHLTSYYARIAARSKSDDPDDPFRSFDGVTPAGVRRILTDAADKDGNCMTCGRYIPASDRETDKDASSSSPSSGSSSPGPDGSNGRPSTFPLIPPRSSSVGKSSVASESSPSKSLKRNRDQTNGNNDCETAEDEEIGYPMFPSKPSPMVSSSSSSYTPQERYMNSMSSSFEDLPILKSNKIPRSNSWSVSLEPGNTTPKSNLLTQVRSTSISQRTRDTFVQALAGGWRPYWLADPNAPLAALFDFKDGKPITEADIYSILSTGHDLAFDNDYDDDHAAQAAGMEIFAGDFDLYDPAEDHVAAREPVVGNSGIATPNSGTVSLPDSVAVTSLDGESDVGLGAGMNFPVPGETLSGRPPRAHSYPPSNDRRPSSPTLPQFFP